MIPSSRRNLFKEKALVFLGFFFLCSLSLFGQNQAYTDSLELVHRNGLFDEEEHMKILAELIRNYEDQDKIIETCNELIQHAEDADNLSFMLTAYQGKGQAQRIKGDLVDALENLNKASEIALELNDPAAVGIIELNIGDLYYVMQTYDSSIGHYRSSISRFREVQDSIKIAHGLINLGDAYNMIGKPDSALIFLEEAEQLAKVMKYDKGIAYAQGNIGISYAIQGRNQEAQNYMNSTIAILTELPDHYGVSAYLNAISKVYLETGDYSNALLYSTQSLEIAREFGLKEQLADANLKISQIYEARGDTLASYAYFKDHVAYKDSINNLETVQKMADLRTDFEVAKKQLEVDLLNQQKRTQSIITWSTGIALFLLSLVVMGVLRRYRYVNRTNKIIEEEKNRSDLLLLNILPSETAQELKEKGRVQAKRFESVSVLFTDFQGFTLKSQGFSPEKLVASVDYYFSEFDKIIGKYGLEKIKTIGDSYMCAGGLPFASEDHPEKVIEAAMEIRDFIEWADKNKDTDIAHFEMRLGIHTGPVVAGVVGTKKFAYDIWGDTVNVAARMESNSKPGKINISENTYALVKDQYNCTFRGKIDMKNRGKMNMYYVNGRKNA